VLCRAVALAVTAHGGLLFVAVTAPLSAGHRKCSVLALLPWARIYVLGSLASASALESLSEVSAEVDCSG